mgnify:CR=1 FL=1
MNDAPLLMDNGLTGPLAAQRQGTVARECRNIY